MMSRNFLTPVLFAMALGTGCGVEMRAVTDDAVVADDATPPAPLPTPRQPFPRQPPLGPLCDNPSVCPPPAPAPCDSTRVHCPGEPAPEPVCPPQPLIVQQGDPCCYIDTLPDGQRVAINGKITFIGPNDADLKCVP